MKKYFNLKLGKPDVNGSVIVADLSEAPEKMLSDFINSNVGEQNNLHFDVIRKAKDNIYYRGIIPNMEFSGGGYAPALAVNSGPGWSKKEEDIVSLCLTKQGDLKLTKNTTRKGKRAYLSEISRSKAYDLKDGEFNHSMLQLYAAGY